MSNQFHHRSRTSHSILFVLVLLVASLASPLSGAGQGTNVSSMVDLATVPVATSTFPERGYQLGQAGDLEFGAVQASWSPDAVDHGGWEMIGPAWRHGYATVHVLLSDRADSWSEPLATVTTLVIGLESPDAARRAVPLLLDMAGHEGGAELEGVTVDANEAGVLGLRAVGDYVVTVRYAPAVGQGSTRQNTADWTPESIAALVGATSNRLNDAVDRAETAAESLGIANVMFYGLQSPWTLPWLYYPSTEHYRVLDGRTVAYGGELDADLEGAIPDGINDLFVSRQQLGDEGYEHLIDVSLARFDSGAEAAAFAADPDSITFPPTWEFTATYTDDDPLPDGQTVERVQVDDDFLRASGYRSVHQDGNVVQVVRWLASGNAVVTREAIAWLTDLQVSCLDALPEPCAPVYQDEIPAALGEGYGEASEASTDGDDAATPVPGSTGADVLESGQFGWEIAIPNDGWELVDSEMYTNSEYYELQSGQSLLMVESVVDHHGDPQQCVLDNLSLLEALEERSVIDLGSDDPDERAAGLEPDHAWAVYTVEPVAEERADQEYTVRYDCYTLAAGDASLVVTHVAPRDLWTGERDKGQRFREGIRLPPASATTHITPPEGDGRYLGRTLHMGIPRIWILRAA